MKTFYTFIFVLILTVKSHAEDVTDPQVHYLSDYQAGDVVKKIRIDINGDGIQDWLFCTIDSNPDPIIKQAQQQEGGMLPWELYVSNQTTNSYNTCAGIDAGKGLGISVGLQMDPDQVYVGQVSELGKRAIVTLVVKNSRVEAATETIYAYTWEGDHLLRHKLAEYHQDESNAIFDKYLLDDKRTHLTVQHVKP